MTDELMVIIVLWTLNLTACVLLAQHKGLSNWAALGAALILGPLALLYLALQKPAQRYVCPQCEKPIETDWRSCHHCGFDPRVTA